MNELVLGNFYRDLILVNMHEVLGELNINRGAAMLHRKFFTCYIESMPIENKNISVKDLMKA